MADDENPDVANRRYERMAKTAANALNETSKFFSARPGDTLDGDAIARAGYELWRAWRGFGEFEVCEVGGGRK